jgi:hypothetical protein
MKKRKNYRVLIKLILSIVKIMELKKRVFLRFIRKVKEIMIIF